MECPSPSASQEEGRPERLDERAIWRMGWREAKGRNGRVSLGCDA